MSNLANNMLSSSEGPKGPSSGLKALEASQHVIGLCLT